MKKYLFFIAMVFVLTLTGCKDKKRELLIVTTTSLDNSGLLAYILPTFEEEYDCEVKVVALGTGAALELGKLGEADILLVHDLQREIQFVEDGFGEKRKNIMYNDFIFVGPDLIDANNVQEVLDFFESGNDFYSRGDNSGTHARELSIWDEYSFDVETFGSWYKETGQGMGATLTMASLAEGYTFTDRGTYLSMQDNLELVISYENTPRLMNTYGIIKVSEELHDRDAELAELFYEWITQEETKDLIKTYIKYGEQLFYPYSTYREE